MSQPPSALSTSPSTDFVSSFENKYRETGKTKDAAFAELHAAGLKQLVAQSDTSELCDRVDEHLINGFPEFFAKRRR